MNKPMPPDSFAGTDVLLRNDEGGIATLTLNRPQARNGLSEALLEALQTNLDEIAGDDAVRVVIICRQRSCILCRTRFEGNDGAAQR